MKYNVEYKIENMMEQITSNTVNTERKISVIQEDDIPFEVRMKHIIKAYRKDIVRLEQLQRYAEGLEEENVALQKKLEQQAVDKETSRKRKETIYDLRRIVKSQEIYIGRLQLLLAEHDIPYHYKAPVNELEKAGIETDNIMIVRNLMK